MGPAVFSTGGRIGNCDLGLLHVEENKIDTEGEFLMRAYAPSISFCKNLRGSRASALSMALAVFAWTPGHSEAQADGDTPSLRASNSAELGDGSYATSTLEQVVVTSQRREEHLEKVPN